ncbi:hypothetical protein AYI69_g8302 [Smittium culicis]|uniref:Uncharacterized protein n=1 Tax=Smittium culicis TaxID=133412 RepID=A0A1R1XKJ4_9FUNG|nr:hypothetical protein AYI69_g8302 [Smittium culicis]
MTRAYKISQTSPPPKQTYSSDSSPHNFIEHSHSISGKENTVEITEDLKVNGSNMQFSYDLGTAFSVVSRKLTEKLGLKIEKDMYSHILTANEDHIKVYKYHQVQQPG